MPKPNKKDQYINTKVDGGLKKKAEEMARQDERAVGQLVRLLLIREWERRQANVPQSQINEQ